MKKIIIVAIAFLTVLTLSACQECEECTKCETCETCTTCETCEVCVITPQLSFYTEMEFEGSGYTPAYTYFLSGTKDELGQITDIRFNMVSAYGTSKRSTDYSMNIARFEIGGTSGNQTINVFIGGSTESIAQVYNTITGTLTADGSETFKSLGVNGAYPGAVVANVEEIYGLLEDELSITIDDTTTVADVLTAIGLYDTENNLVSNGRQLIELTGYKGGRSYNHQLDALEQHIIDNSLTLAEVYTLVSQNNQGYDNRDAVAGATIMFDSKIIAIVAKAADIDVNAGYPEVVGNYVDGTNTIITVKVKGLNELIAQVTIDVNGDVTEITVLDHTETDGYGADVISDGTLFASMINGQDNLEGVDGIAGSTLTSNALLLAVETAIETFLE